MVWQVVWLFISALQRRSYWEQILSFVPTDSASLLKTREFYETYITEFAQHHNNRGRIGSRQSSQSTTITNIELFFSLSPSSFALSHTLTIPICFILAKHFFSIKHFPPRSLLAMTVTVSSKSPQQPKDITDNIPLKLEVRRLYSG